jgi:hypothetical protein
MRLRTARQRQHRRAAEEAFDPVVVEAPAQVMADQPRRHGVEHAAQQEAAAAGDGDQVLLEVAAAPWRQWREERALDLQRAAAVGIGAADQLGDEVTIGGQIGEVAAAGPAPAPA